MKCVWAERENNKIAIITEYKSLFRSPQMLYTDLQKGI